jgi:glycosyltransferase involved in cell wall biosynthesis
MGLISIIIPALNEEKGIGRTINSIPIQELNNLDWKVEIIVIDGNSSDKTREIATRAGANVKIETRKGYGRAYKSGFKYANGDVIVTLDADGTYPASKIPVLVNILMKRNLDFITTNRFGFLEKGSMSRLHLLGNRILSLLTLILHSINMVDSQSGMWIFKKSIISQLNLKSDGMEFSEEIKIKAFKNFHSTEVPINYKKRIGKAKINDIKDGYRILLYLIQLTKL